MCLGKAPSCGVHTLLIAHHRAIAPRVQGLWWYAKGCHACDALADEFGVPEGVDTSREWNGYIIPQPNDVEARDE